MAIFKMNNSRDANPNALVLFEFLNEPNIKVGIGMENPIDKLHVAGNIRCEGLGGSVSFTNPTKGITVAGNCFITGIGTVFTNRLKAHGGIEYKFDGLLQTTASYPRIGPGPQEIVEVDSGKRLIYQNGQIIIVQNV